MNKLYLMRHPYLFQGEKYLKKNKNYFEGWYFKNTNNDTGISFIPGVSITNDEKKAFIQVITPTSSYYINYDISEFKFNYEPFYIKIGNNFFSKKRISIDINEKEHNLTIIGKLKYSNSRNIKTSNFKPNIMGPFSYIPFMECNHAILSMKNNVNGLIKINDEEIIFDNGNGYIEKDWGISFPKTYIWAQGNNFKKSNASFMISIANIPFKAFHFKGVICSLINNNKEFRFATYNNAKIKKYEINNNSLIIVLKKGRYYLEIESTYRDSNKLIAPTNGKMKKDILESINSIITITLTKGNEIIFSDTSNNCGLEIVNK